MKNTKIKLNFPVLVDGTDYKELSLRRPKVRDLIAADADNDSSAKKEVFMFATLSELPIEVIEELDAKDYRSLQEVYQGFLD